MAIQHLKTNPHISQSPVYRGGDSIAMIQAKYGLEQIDKLASNENPLPTSTAVRNALTATLSDLNRYPPATDEELRNGLSATFGRGLTPEHFMVGNSGCDLLNMIAVAFTGEGDEAIICRPTFPVYELTLKRRGATVVYADLDEQFNYNVERILSAVSAKTRLLYLTSPNNPTGSILTQSQLDELMAGLPEHVLVVADNVYFHFNTHPEKSDPIPHILAGRNIVMLNSFSKVYGLAGMRLGYVIGAPDVIDYLARMKLPFHTNALALTAGMAALHDRDYIEETVSMTLAERERLFGALDSMDGIEAYPSQANFLLFKPTGAVGGAISTAVDDANELSDALQQQGTIVRPLNGFYMPGYLRVSVGQPAENDRFLKNLGALMADA